MRLMVDVIYHFDQIKGWIRGVREYLYEFIITGHMGKD